MFNSRSSHCLSLTAAPAGLESKLSEQCGATAAAGQRIGRLAPPRDASNAVVVQDADGEMFTLKRATGCPDLVVTRSDRIFVHSGGSEADVILRHQHLTCAVAEMEPAAAD